MYGHLSALSYMPSDSEEIATGVQHPSYKESNTVCSKLGAQVILRGILGLQIDEDAIPVQDEFCAFDTVVEAPSVRVAEGGITLESEDNS
jgi:hypothetical protein